VELDGVADSDEIDWCSVVSGFGSTKSCLGVPVVAGTAYDLSLPTMVIFGARLYTLFFLVSLLCGDFSPTDFMA